MLISYWAGLSLDRIASLSFETGDGEALLNSDRLVSVMSRRRRVSVFRESGAAELLAAFVRRGGLIARHEAR